jgi:hypothetical protein
MRVWKSLLIMVYTIFPRLIRGLVAISFLLSVISAEIPSIAFPHHSQTCWWGTAPNATTIHVNGHELSFGELLHQMIPSICGGGCEDTVGLGSFFHRSTPGVIDDRDCEVAVLLPNAVEAYLYRRSSADGERSKQCRDSITQIIDDCIKNGPNSGRMVGPGEGREFEAGFRPLAQPEPPTKGITSTLRPSPTPLFQIASHGLAAAVPKVAVSQKAFNFCEFVQENWRVFFSVPRIDG